MKHKTFFTIFQLLIVGIAGEAVGQQIVPDSIYIDNFGDNIQVYQRYDYQGSTTYQYLSDWTTHVGTEAFYTQNDDFYTNIYRSFLEFTEDDFDPILSIDDDITITKVKVQYKSRVGNTFKVVHITESLSTYTGGQTELAQDWQNIGNGNSIGANSLQGDGSFETTPQMF